MLLRDQHPKGENSIMVPIGGTSKKYKQEKLAGKISVEN